VQYIYSKFFERLLPEFNLPQLWHADTVHAVFLSNCYKHFDLSAAYSVNFINIGEIDVLDSFGVVTDTTLSTEMVSSFAFGLRYNDMLSLGFTVKNFNSRLAPGIGPYEYSGVAEGQVFDFGVRLERKFTLADVLDIHPALGFAIHSWPQDSSDYHTGDTLDGRDPLPLKRWFGGSIAINLLDLFGFTYANESEYAVVDQEFIRHQGYKIQITPFFALLRGTMTDSMGQRFERPEGRQFTFNYQQVTSAIIRCIALFNPELSRRVENWRAVPEKHHLRPNFFYQYTVDSIHSSGPNTVREGQKREETAFGFSLIGDLKGIPSLKNALYEAFHDKKEKVPGRKKEERRDSPDTLSMPPVRHEPAADTARILQDGDLVE
jgi:hypothetical protein